METQEEIKVPDALYEIANMIQKDWRKQGKGVSPYAKPYLEAMFSLEKITDKYYLDSGESIVAYFLGNATSWRGPVAKAVKAKLKKMLK